MKKKIINYILMVIILFQVVGVEARECSNQELNKIRNLATLVNFEIKYLGEKSEDEYGIYITGLDESFLIEHNKEEYSNNSLIRGLKPKETYKLEFILNYETGCWQKFQYVRRITMPSYNKYHNSEICNENPEISYCKLTYDSSDMTKEQFEKQVEKYLDSLNEEPIIIENKGINLKTIIIVGIVSLIIIIVIISLIIKGKKKDAYL